MWGLAMGLVEDSMNWLEWDMYTIYMYTISFVCDSQTNSLLLFHADVKIHGF